MNKKLLKKARRAKRQFLNKYSSSAYGKYLRGVGIGFSNREDPDEIHLAVRLVKPLPPNLALPTTYKGFRVETKVIGKIRPL